MRSLEDHLSPQELVTLPESREALACGSSEQQSLLQHLETCEPCAAVAQSRWALKALMEPRMARDEVCPATDVWLEVAVGLRVQDSAQWLHHLAECSRCAADLKEALELMQMAEIDDKATGADATNRLASSSMEWQHSMAAQMAQAASPDAGVGHPVYGAIRQRRSTLLFGLIAVPVAAVLAVVAAIGIWRFAHPSDAHLLTVAYNKQRTLVLRIPGALPVPMASGTRGSMSGLAEPAELLELRLRTQRHLDQTPDSPYWHQVLGEISLLEGDAESARRNLEIAQTSDNRLPNLENDLAAAWFEIGDKTGNAEDYAEAAELYSQQIHAHAPDQSLLYFNRAMCWERQNLNQQAVDDLRFALSSERSEAWRKAIQAELDRLSAHSDAVPDDYELALSKAIENLLPHWFQSPQDRTAISRIAELGRRHHDRWLPDWIAAPHTSASAMADEHLALALSAASRGEAQASLDEAKNAAILYRQSQNNPGLVRAQLAEVYALQRLGRARDCIDLADPLERQSQAREYAPLAAQILLQAAICQSRIGAFRTAQSDLSAAQSLSETGGLPHVRMNIGSMQADLLGVEGLTSAAWQAEVDGLATCDRIQCAPGVRYKFLDHMVRSAQDLNLLFTASVLMKNAAQLAAQSRDVVTHAYALETLATVTGRTGEYDASAHDFAEASRVAAPGNRSAIIALYQAEWRVDQAEILSLAGNPRAALASLRQSSAAILASDYLPARISYFNQLSIAQLALGQSSDALASAVAATQETERSLASLTSVVDRQQWTRENAPIYWQLVKVYLRLGLDTQALQAWERYRSAPYLSAGVIVSTKARSLEAGRRVLVLARIDDTYVGWLAAMQPVQALRTVILGDHAHLEAAANTFYRLCADRDSRIVDISSLGSRLYLALLQPFISPQDSPSLWIDLDPSLSMLPLSALKLPDGNWLGNTARVTVLPPWWSLDPSSASQDQPIEKTMHFLAVNGFASGTGDDSEAYSIAKLFNAATVIDGRMVSSDGVVHDASTTQIFHFSGHAASSTSARLLLNSASTGTPEFLSPDSFGGMRLPQCRLAVLAACNTTAADPDQIEKLPDMRNALLLSGAHAVVASNWDVDDRSTNALMLSFYHQLLSGSPVAEALRAAEQSVRSFPAWQHPFFWAAFEVFTR